MKRALIFAAAAMAAAAFSGCGKDLVTEDSFFIDISRIAPRRIYVDITPENNDFYYYFGVVPAEDFERYPGEKAFVDDVFRNLHKMYDDIKDIGEGDPVPFNDAMLYKGSMYRSITELTPLTDYFLYAIKCDRKGNPMTPVITNWFKTADADYSEIKFTAKAEGTTITVVPDRNDPYYWDYELVSTVRNDYGTPEMYYWSTVEMLYEYDLLESQLSRGNDSEDMAAFYELEAGDLLYLVAGGYERDYTTTPFVWLVKYNGPDSETEVEPLVIGKPVDIFSPGPEFSHRHLPVNVGRNLPGHLSGRPLK